MPNGNGRVDIKTIILVIVAMGSLVFGTAQGTAASIARRTDETEESLMLNASRKAQAVYDIQIQQAGRITVLETNYMHFEQTQREIKEMVNKILDRLEATH